MRLASAQKVHYDSGPNMTPLVDVVMVILIFLMLTGTFAGASWYLRSNLPPLEGAATPSSTDVFGKDVKIEIRIQARGEVMSAFVAGGQKEFTDEDTLTAMLKQLKEKFKTEQNKKDDDIQVIIRPDPFVRYQVLVRVHSAALNADLTKIAFATSK